jgi:outer membrane protein assembly factor BamB
MNRQSPLGFHNIWFRLQCLLCVAITCQALADDWTRWRGPTGDGHVGIGEARLTIFPEDPEVILKIPTGGGFASPIIAQNRVYIFDNQDNKETLRAIDLDSQKEVWTHSVDQTFKDGQGAPGPRNTPQADGDRLYAVSCRGEMHCIKADDGQLIWKRNYSSDFGATFIGEKGSIQGAARHGNNGSPLILGDRLYACAGGTNGSSVICLNKHTGELIWKSQNDLAGYAPPLIAKVGGAEQLFCYTVEGLVSLNPKDGALHWRFPISTPFGRHVTTPIGYQGLVIVSSVEEGLMATETQISNNKIVHKRAWTSKPNAINFSSPIRIGGYLYGLGPQKNLICVDLATGRQQWSKTGYIFTSADKAHAAFIAMNNKVLALTDTGELVLFEANPNKFVELGRVQVCGKTWSNPAYSNGVLYLRDGLTKPGHLYGIRLTDAQ